MLNPGNGSLALMMANSGYEVWIGNTRSSNYTYGHLKYTRNDKVNTYSCEDQFQSLSTAIIDYIVDYSGVLGLDVGQPCGNGLACHVTARL